MAGPGLLSRCISGIENRGTYSNVMLVLRDGIVDYAKKQSLLNRWNPGSGQSVFFRILGWDNIRWAAFGYKGGGNSKIFVLFTPEPWGDDPNLTHIFSDGLKPPTAF